MADFDDDGLESQESKTQMNGHDNFIPNFIPDHLEHVQSLSEVLSPSVSVDSVTSSVLARMKSLDLDDENGECDLMAKDLQVRVDNPEKHSSAVEAYVTFRVLTKTTRSDYDSPEYCVRRRYNDFIWLRGRFEDTHPTHIIPPLPEKHSFQRLSRFNVEFVKARMSALSKFLVRVSDHPVLSFDKDFQLFLTLKPFEFTAHKQQNRTSLMRRMSGAFQSVATGYMMKNRTPEFATITEYVHKFEVRLSNIERIAHRINKEREEYVDELQEFHPVFTLWSSSEEQLSGALLATSTAIEKCSKAHSIVVTNFDSYNRIIREYILYVDALKSALNRRDTLQLDYELSVDELTNRKKERDQMSESKMNMLEDSNQQYSISIVMLRRSAEDIKKEKQDKVENVIESLIKQTEANNEKLECGNADLRLDVEHWNKTKNSDFKKVFMTMADQHIWLYQTCLAAWEEAIQVIRDTDFTSSTDDNRLSL